MITLTFDETKYKLVPIEPTEAMIECVNAGCDEPDADLAWTWERWLAAAPAADREGA